MKFGTLYVDWSNIFTNIYILNTNSHILQLFCREWADRYNALWTQALCSCGPYNTSSSHLSVRSVQNNQKYVNLRPVFSAVYRFCVRHYGAGHASIEKKMKKCVFYSASRLVMFPVWFLLCLWIVNSMLRTVTDDNGGTFVYNIVFGSYFQCVGHFNFYLINSPFEVTLKPIYRYT